MWNDGIRHGKNSSKPLDNSGQQKCATPFRGIWRSETRFLGVVCSAFGGHPEINTKQSKARGGKQLPGAGGLSIEGGGGGRDLLEQGGGGGGGPGEGGGGPGGRPPPCRNIPNPQQKNYWRMNNSAHGNVMLSAVNKGNSSLNVNSGFPHLTNIQQLQQSGTFTISCQMTVIFLVSQSLA